ncbi:bifunctional 4-hydroxy-2-oxoglutarate aldolase/2-dehydro-3-deoxy-phosphogluconate aldolase [Porticoccaceae bacterium]|nr:bifunctional 4-hydroxy-2-oxoglutarate aldolase/2-dehydro-3-deoxy-phosphogluconate aldolase [Porticoccaceae bacterium]MDB4262735.1 bifunctional 4-hydroxy-2-oxoglutarate aldolase/2-dehydro-3-deoxy-phosphogluconate aldolase [Porticoccaceae bacterium]MDB9724262.1 bifunctional 4-hydroxy-2-oxoglutarate aldolase/2-dehydro-3-deoxy-phosphogluconate aldolase [bacterium]MDC0000499.1 bifunctional 4-hydroxy-2-oxoglutarate aldolase/2-dehydro-3-deoxy-phosphogluconate aldolase [Porticoccaceae bacterium]
MRNLLAGNPVVPVITLERVEDAVPLAEALVAGGLKVLEVTLRTEAAIEGIKQIIKHVPGAIVGTGTVCKEQQIKLSEDIGCQFMISPGATDKLLQAAQKSSIPLLPGISSVSELMRGLEYGHRDFKFFPAEAAGGVPVLKAMAGPFGDIKFCPTGGIGLHNVLAYLALPNVLCVGGSWIAQPKLIQAKNWAEIEKLAREAVALAG